MSTRSTRYALTRMPLLALIVRCISSLTLAVVDYSCTLFHQEDFLAFEYLDDLWFHEFDGPGNRFSAVLG